jgi:diphosphomevalonate decarboxylase
MYENPKLIIDSSLDNEGRITWTSPSNIALVKYWGKYGQQMPRNPSVSFTLDEAHTYLSLEWQTKAKMDDKISLQLYFGQVHHPVFEQKIQHKLLALLPYFPFLKQLELTIDTVNSFPHSAGIASSASSMSALALSLCSLEHELFGTLEDDTAFDQKASFLARLLSGSACRSIYGYAAVWGERTEVPGSSDLFACPLHEQLHPIFQTYQNAILLVSRAEKAVSSTAGHQLMEDNPFAEPRYAQARMRMEGMLSCLKSGDVEDFGRLLEAEALALHALMMLSSPPYVLMVPESLILMEKIKAFRNDTRIPAYFTLDAGPNIHLLYPEEHHEAVSSFIISELSPHCQDGMYIADRVGEGPEQS